MYCEHCLKLHPLECGVTHAVYRVGAAATRSVRAVLARLAQLG